MDSILREFFVSEAKSLLKIAQNRSKLLKIAHDNDESKTRPPRALAGSCANEFCLEGYVWDTCVCL